MARYAEANHAQDLGVEGLKGLEVPALETLLEDASRIFDRAAEVPDNYFAPAEPDSLATPRLFYGDGTDFLFLPPYIPGSLGDVLIPAATASLEFIEIEGGLMRTIAGATASLGLTDPAAWGAALRGQRGRRPWDGWPYGFAISVTARWGWPAVPGDVRQSTIQIAIKTYRETDPAFTKIQELDGQVIRESLPPMAKMIAEQWKSRAIRFQSA